MQEQVQCNARANDTIPIPPKWYTFSLALTWLAPAINVQEFEFRWRERDAEAESKAPGRRTIKTNVEIKSLYAA